MVRFSVLIPVAPWEQPDIVSASLRSLEAQSYLPSQIVVSCDGFPPPLLLSVLHNLSIEHSIIIGPGREGVGPVLARGLLSCQHEYVVRADADDISQPTRCEILLNAFVLQPEVAVMGSSISEFISLDNENVITSERIVPTNSLSIYRMSRYRNPMNHPSVILRKSLILSVGNYRSMPGFEDYDLWLRLIANFGPSALANIEASLVLVRVGANHLSRRHGFNYAKSELMFLLQCGRDKYLPWLFVFLSVVIRFPLRLLPRKLLSSVMSVLTRKSL